MSQRCQRLLTFTNSYRNLALGEICNFTASVSLTHFLSLSLFHHKQSILHFTGFKGMLAILLTLFLFLLAVYCWLSLASSSTFRSWRQTIALYHRQPPTNRQQSTVVHPSIPPTNFIPFASCVHVHCVGYKHSRWWLDRPTDTGDFEVRSWCASPVTADEPKFCWISSGLLNIEETKWRRNGKTT